LNARVCNIIALGRMHHACRPRRINLHSYRLEAAVL
jgi:hypothetical protein